MRELTDRRKIRIAYLSGPCDGPAVYKAWSEHQRQEFFGTDFMKQFLQLCEDLDGEAYIITSLPGEYVKCKRGRFIFDNHPKPYNLRGAMYHLAFLPWFARVVPKIIRFRPDVMIATENAAYWFLLFPLRWFGIPILPSFHPIPWPKYTHRKLSSRILWQLTRLLVLKHLKAVVVISHDIARQLQQLLGDDMAHIEVLRHLPTYPISQFSSIPPPNLATRPPFRIFFIGRTEANKGIYDLVEVARRLQQERAGVFHFDICGTGAELENLEQAISALSLRNVITCHGYCSADRVAELLGQSHAVIVPSKSDFDAGYEMVCAEAILAGRPLIASAVCPALEDLHDAAIEVVPDDVGQYCEAILRLNDDLDLYCRKSSACAALQAQFYDRKNSWYEKIKEGLGYCIPHLVGRASNVD